MLGGGVDAATLVAALGAGPPPTAHQPHSNGAVGEPYHIHTYIYNRTYSNLQIGVYTRVLALAF